LKGLREYKSKIREMKQARLGYSEETSPIAGLLMNSTVPVGVIPKI